MCYLRFMVIAVMVSLSPVNAKRADRYFFNQVLSSLASRQTQHHYYICTDAPQEVVVKASNVTPLHAPYINGSRFFSFWRQVVHRRLLKKIGAEEVFCFGAGLYLPSRLPYCILLNPVEPGRKPSGRISKVLRGAKSVLTFSAGTKAAICQQYHVPAEKVGVVHAAAPEMPLSFDDDLQTRMKERYTEGCEYFLYTGSFEDQALLVNLLKAFSIFKKRQKTSWKLVMVNREMGVPAEFTEALRTYKYREEVVMLQENEDLPYLLSAGYAFVYPSMEEDNGLYILEAMHFGLPIVAGHNNIIDEIAGEAAMYYNGGVSDLAEKLMLLYKDENLRSRQVERVKEVVARYSWERTAEEMMGMRNGRDVNRQT